MLGVAGGLAVAIAALFLALWFWPEEKEAPTGKGGGGAVVKVDRKLAEQGKQIAQSNGCLSCHSIDGSKGAGPTWKGIYAADVKLEGGETVKVDDKYLKTATLDPGTEVVKGFGPSMPAYEGKLSGGDVKAITEYIKSLRG